MTKQEIERIKRLSDGFHQITEEFKTWVNSDFKQLSTNIGELVKQSGTLLASTEACVKLSNDLAVLSERVAEKSKEVLTMGMKIEYNPKAKAMHIKLTDAVPYFGIVDHTQELTNNVLIDWLKDGTIYGIDISGLESTPFIEVSDD